VDQAAQRIYNMLAISSHVQEAKAGLGRGLRVNQLPDADTYLNTVSKADIGPEPTYGQTARCLGRARRSKIGSSYGSPRRVSLSFERRS
jgi:hypothetical protein